MHDKMIEKVKWYLHMYSGIKKRDDFVAKFDKKCYGN